MEEIKKTGVIILNYNNSKDTINCIKSVEQYNTAPIKYIIVDNGSSNKQTTKEIISFLEKDFKNDFLIIEENQKIPTKLSKINFLISMTNDGYAQGNNKGLNIANSDSEIDTILILNSDILFVEDIIPQLIEDLRILDNAAIISPVLYKKNLKDIDYTCSRKAVTLTQNFIIHMFLYMNIAGIITKITNKNNLLLGKKVPLKNNILEIQLPSGSCMLLNKTFFKQIDFFDPNTFLYYEENILFAKIHKLNKKIYLDTRLKCIHLGATTTKTKVPSKFIINCAIQSNKYYITHYTKANKIYTFCMQIFYLLWKLKIYIKTKLTL